MNRKILIVEDDKYIIEGVTELLFEEGYDVCSATTGMHALAEFERNSISLIIMDVNLGEDNGFELCTKIRKTSSVPILFLTAGNTEDEIVRGFKNGGDDYITKPFRSAELLVRIEALLRRSENHNKCLLLSGEICYRIDDNRVYHNGRDMLMSHNELAVIRTLMKKWPEIVNRSQLMKEIWGTDNIDICTLNVNINRVREKIGKYGNDDYIETVRGKGYRWALPVQK